MIPTASIEVQIDKLAVRDYVNKKIEEEVKQALWFVDVKRLAELTCMSERFLEDEFLSDPRMRAIEIKKSRKRWYPAQSAKEVILEITNEW
ncbi:hypothetical protein AAGS61_04235 [Lysinibacillus sp. KU-BSD001]|uniref:hypothetical protein n=1 Tax=Lysinibacillus sp. KU-BSD001 TaxID=3141328 RepID=UPI0036EC3FBE